MHGGRARRPALGFLLIAGFFEDFAIEPADDRRRNYGTTGVFLFIATAMVSVFIVIASMGPRTTNLRLEAISR